MSDSPSSRTISRSSTVENDMVFSRSVNILLKLKFCTEKIILYFPYLEFAYGEWKKVI